MKVAFFDLEEWHIPELQRGIKEMGLAPRINPQFFTEHLTPHLAELNADLEAIAIFVWTRLTPEVLRKLPSLKLVLTMSTGFDHIDLKTCAEKSIIVCNVPHYGENTVAEHTFALILALSRRLNQAFFQNLRGSYRINELQGFDLYGKTLGVVGAGNIGLHVIRIARGFGMHVLAYDIVTRPLLAEVLGFRYTDLDTLLSQSDIVSLHVPATPETFHLINEERIKKMKKGALLINTARGSVVDTEALLRALDENHLGGAGLDVIEGEEFVKEESALLRLPVAEETLRHVVQAHLLAKRENVVFTPHIAFNSQEAIQRILQTTLENLKAFLDGAPVNVVPTA